MSDRTQTLSVEEIEQEAKMLCYAAESIELQFPGFAVSLRDLAAKLRTALSQPEHQGDEANSRWVELQVIRGRPHTQFSCVGPIVAAEGAIYPEGNWERCLYVPKHKAREHAEAIAEERNVAQLSAPVLSDEERGRLEDLCDGCERQRVGCVSVGEEVLCAECVLLRCKQFEEDLLSEEDEFFDLSYGEMKARAERAETALKELAEKLQSFEQQARGKARLAYFQPKKRAALLGSAAAFVDALVLAREKAAKLKEGER